MRFSRHAKNKMRLYGVTPDEVLEIISSANQAGEDSRGNQRYIGKILVGAFDSVFLHDAA